MTDGRPAVKLPVSFFVMNVLGALFLAAGVTGLAAPDFVPQLAASAVAFSLIGVGLTLECASVVQLLSAQAASRRR